MKTLKTSKFNKTTITEEQLNECYCGNHLFLPFKFFNNETGELLPTGDCVLKFSGLNDDDEACYINDFKHFLKILEFAANVGIGDGLRGLSEHLQINGYSMKVTGVLARTDFLKKEGEFGYEDVEFSHFQ